MILAKIDDFILQNTTSIYEDHVVRTHEIEICKFISNKSVYTIATFDDEGQIVSCGDRLLDSINSEDDAHAVKALARIAGIIILGTENVPSLWHEYVVEHDNLPFS